MLIDEKSIYEVTGGDYSVYCFGYTQARTVTNDIMKRDPWGGIPFVLRKDLEFSWTTVVMWLCLGTHWTRFYF